MQDSRHTLVIDVAGQPERRLELALDRVRIGRARDCELRLELPQVAEVHAEIRRDGRRFELRDLGSKAGVFVNGVRTEHRLLLVGDVIELGAKSPVRIRFAVAAARKEAAGGAASPGAMSTATAPGAMAHLARFFEFSRKLGGAFALDEVLREVVDLAIELTGAERGVLGQLRDDQGLGLSVARDASGAELEAAGLKISETLARQAMEGRAPLVVADVNTDQELSRSTSIVSLELRSAVILPLSRTGADGQPAVFGVLYLDSRKRRGAFASLDLHILERLAHDASAAIEHARLLREAAERRRIEQEVQTARKIQAALMPDEFMSTPLFEIAGRCEPCNELGGDYIDQFDLGADGTAVVVADVCGKGIAASLLAAALQGALAAMVDGRQPLAELAARVNRVHCGLAPADKFVTMALVVLGATGDVRLVNAGHCHPLHVHASGVANLTVSGMALGIDETAAYREVAVAMQRGDYLVLVSDGILECHAPDQSLYGSARLEVLLDRCRGLPAGDVLETIVASVAAFRRDAPVADDSSVVVVRRL